MKIYMLEWFNEDGYGPTDGLYVIVQAKNGIKALEAAKSYVKDMYNTTIKELKEENEKYEIKDITNYPVISSGHIGF